MFESTPKTPSSAPAGPRAPFTGLGHAVEEVEAVALHFCPRWEAVSVSDRPLSQPVKAHGYVLQCRLGRATRAG